MLKSNMKSKKVESKKKQGTVKKSLTKEEKTFLNEYLKVDRRELHLQDLADKYGVSKITVYRMRNRLLAKISN